MSVILSVITTITESSYAVSTAKTCHFWLLQLHSLYRCKRHYYDIGCDAPCSCMADVLRLLPRWLMPVLQLFSLVSVCAHAAEVASHGLATWHGSSLAGYQDRHNCTDRQTKIDIHI